MKKKTILNLIMVLLGALGIGLAFENIHFGGFLFGMWMYYVTFYSGSHEE